MRLVFGKWADDLDDEGMLARGKMDISELENRFGRVRVIES